MKSLKPIDQLLHEAGLNNYYNITENAPESGPEIDVPSTNLVVALIFGITTIIAILAEHHLSLMCRYFTGCSVSLLVVGRNVSGHPQVSPMCDSHWWRLSLPSTTPVKRPFKIIGVDVMELPKTE